MLIQAVILAFGLPVLASEPVPSLPPVLPGWDSCKWTDMMHQTPKYVVGRLMAGVPPSPNGLAAIVPAVNVHYPGTSLVDSSGMDKINIPCVGVIDAVVNSGGKENPDRGDSWAWQVVEDKCGACRPNKCEEVSKSKKCGAAPAANSSKGGSAFGARPSGGVANAGGANGGSSGGNTGNSGGTTRNHPDQSAVVAQAKADLESAGHDLSGPCGAFAIVKLAAWRMGGGAGLLDKPSGNNCEGYATDIIVYSDGHHYDVLVDGGGRNTPAWGDDGMVDPSRYRAAFDPGQH